MICFHLLSNLGAGKRKHTRAVPHVFGELLLIRRLGVRCYPNPRASLSGRLAAGHHRMNTCSNTRQARRWKAEVKTEEVDGKKEK